MDRGERRQRDQIYVNRIKREMKDIRYRNQKNIANNLCRFPFYLDWSGTRSSFAWLWEHNLGAKKKRPMTCGCTKKTFGRPKIPNGGCKAWPWIPRSRWRRQLDDE